jgi:signal transduction histidine kinase
VRLLPTSLFGRMLVLSLLASLAALVIAGVAISGVLERFVTSGVDARLGDRLVALESAVRPDGMLDRAQLARVTARIAPDEPWRIELPGNTVGDGGDVVQLDTPPRHRPPPRRPDPPDPDRHDRLDDDLDRVEGRLSGGERVHGLTTTIRTSAGEARVLVAVPRAEIDRPVLAALAPLGASLLILGLALGGAALLQLRLGLRPLRALQRSVEEIRRGQATRVPEDVPDELVPLARELNALAADNAAALEGARASAANLAHALKTPIATLGLQLAGDAAAQVQLARIDVTLRHHLGRARIAATNRRATTMLAPALADLADTIAALHGGRVAILVDVDQDLSVAIAAQDLDELAGNLIDNAARYAIRQVVVTAAIVDRLVLLTVADDGPGIAPAERARATAPGIRLDERSDGHGFGLAIVREIAELHGGTLTLDEAPEGGLRARVSLPFIHQDIG